MTAYTTPSTPFPSHLIDDVMPSLKDTEWRVLCVIVRQTLGWKQGDSGKRKYSDWLSHRQLMTRTGRSSEAICNALDVLVRRNLIVIENVDGELMLLPHERRRSSGRLYFRLSERAMGLTADPDVDKPVDNGTKTEKVDRKTEFRKPKTTKETRNKNNIGGWSRCIAARS